MRTALAALLDTVVAAALAYVGFSIGDALAACRDPSNCPPLTPLTVLGVAAGVAIYLAVGQILWRTTPGRRLFAAPPPPADDEL
jgi:hypothetical protein